MTATAHVRVPDASTTTTHALQPDHMPSEKCTLALDSHSDVTIAESRFVYRTKTIDEKSPPEEAQHRSHGKVWSTLSRMTDRLLPYLLWSPPSRTNSRLTAQFCWDRHNSIN